MKKEEKRERKIKVEELKLSRRTKNPTPEDY